MPPDRFLEDATPGEAPAHEDTQQLVEAEHGRGSQGINRRWQASNSAAVVLTSDQAGVKISRDAGATPPTQVIVDGTAAGNGLTGTYPNPSLAPATMDILAPPGAIIAWAGTGAPAGWLPCDGRLLVATDYPRLFTAITTLYGFGGPGTFRLPDLQGRVILSASGGHALTTPGGQETVPSSVHTHPGSHSHGMNSHTHGPGVHTHGLNNHTHGYDHAHGLSGHTHTPGLHTHTTDLNHNHALASGVAVASGAITGVHEGPSAVVNVSAQNHAHDVDLPALGSTNGTSGGPTAADTGTPSPASTPTLTPTATSVPTPTLTGTPSADATAAATGSTATDPTAHNASYPAPGTIATMMPFLTLQYVIRAV